MIPSVMVNGKKYVSMEIVTKSMRNGSLCPKCKYSFSKVIDTRLNKSLQSVRRRRECLNCGCRWSTLEIRCVKSERSRKESRHEL